ncbi:MAG: undecaprenyl-diphosphate phosphatase [Spirochaetales bacterium]|nr:undecaprenyl-diphosphate phosphatase [Spirochaetales bacterium]
MDQLKTIIDSIIIGVVQGLTEFLPISSSGHVELAKRLLDFDANRFFTVLLHMATLAAVIIVFRRKIVALFAALLRILGRRRREGDSVLGRLWLLLVVSTAVTVPVALVFGKMDEFVLAHPKLIGVCFLFTAAVLVASAFFKASRGYDRLSFPASIAIGAAQGVAVLSGVSRSGLTVSAGLAAGLERESAAEYSFLLAIPAILGAFLIDLKDAAGTVAQVSLPGLAAGFVAAFAAGLLAIILFVKLVKAGRLWLFAIYLVPAGVLTIIFI